VLLLNNINSFSRSRERAGEFGDDLLAVDVPLPKLAFFSQTCCPACCAAKTNTWSSAASTGCGWRASRRNPQRARRCRA
jgi:hypothetical protein